jgi:hypothetical protein
MWVWFLVLTFQLCNYVFRDRRISWLYIVAVTPLRRENVSLATKKKILEIENLLVIMEIYLCKELMIS